MNKEVTFYCKTRIGQSRSLERILKNRIHSLMEDENRRSKHSPNAVLQPSLKRQTAIPGITEDDFEIDIKDFDILPRIKENNLTEETTTRSPEITEKNSTRKKPKRVRAILKKYSKRFLPIEKLNDLLL